MLESTAGSGGSLRTAVGLLVASLCLAFATTAQGQAEDQEVKKGERREYVTSTPEFEQRMNQQTSDDADRQARIKAEELVAGPDARNYSGNLCQLRQRDCAGDVRLLDWVENGYGLAEEVTFGGRTGATISGTVWATETGPPSRPGVVIVNGADAPENHYWAFAQVLAKRGYVVLTFDPIAHGQSDTLGEAPDADVPPHRVNFAATTEDAIDFFLSTPDAPYAPRPSCGTGTDHGPKHGRRVDLGLNESFNPYWELLDAGRLGLAGHSAGAVAASFVGQIDERVDAIAAWDNLVPPASFGPEEFFAAPECGSGSSEWPEQFEPRSPAIGFSNDFGNLQEIAGLGDEQVNDATRAYEAAGIDTMQINRRGGTHYEYPFISGEVVAEFGEATLRGQDMAVWYTAAWFDRHVRCQGSKPCEQDADRRLLTDRWNDDLREGQVDFGGDSNLFSIGLASSFAFDDASGSRQVCEDMRQGCENMGPDGHPEGYSFIAETNTLDEPDEPGSPGSGDGGGAGEPCAVGQRGSDAPDDETTLPPTDGGDSIRGMGGDDRLHGRKGDDCLKGNGGDDRVHGNRDDDEIRGNRGDDVVGGNRGDDDVRGNAGDDRVAAGDGSDRLRGGAGDDSLIGGKGPDRLGGGSGNDRHFVRGGGKDLVRCGTGRGDRVFADSSDKIARSCEKVWIDGKRV